MAKTFHYGQVYWTKVGREWCVVVVETVSVSGNEVIVRTPKGNSVYRDPRQLHVTHGGVAAAKTEFAQWGAPKE